jgi:hypothetical protein
MAENRKAGAALGISITGAIAAALAYINSRKASAAPGGEVILPEEFMQLIIAIAASTDNVDSNINQIIQALNTLAINVQGWPANADSLAALRVDILMTGTQLPFIPIPGGMSLVIKAWALNAGWLQVGASRAECQNVNQSFPLLPSEIVAYQIQNADQIWIAANAAGCFACLTVEQRRKGGG